MVIGGLLLRDLILILEMETRYYMLPLLAGYQITLILLSLVHVKQFPSLDLRSFVLPKVSLPTTSTPTPARGDPEKL